MDDELNTALNEMWEAAYQMGKESGLRLAEIRRLTDHILEKQDDKDAKKD